MTSSTITAAPAVRTRACPLCGTPAGEPCQPKPAGDHLARFLDAYTAGQITKAYLAMVLGDLVVVDGCVVVGALEPALAEVAANGWCPASTELDYDETVYCEREAGHPGSHRAPGPDEGSEVAWGDEPTPEERLLLAISGADPDDAHNVRELRKHAVTCTKDDHTYCLAYLSGIPGRASEDEARPHRRAQRDRHGLRAAGTTPGGAR
jgi:hypothetical protein